MRRVRGAVTVVQNLTASSIEVKLQTSDFGVRGEVTAVNDLKHNCSYSLPRPPESEIGLQRQMQNCAAAKCSCVTRIGH